VPGLARLLYGDVRYCYTNIGQSPDPASSKIPLVANAVPHSGGGSSNARLKEAGGKSMGRYAFAISYGGTSVQVCPVN